MNHLLHANHLEALHTMRGALYVGAVLGLLGLMGAFRRLGPVFFLAVLPATVAHELMHWGVALLLNGRPESFRVIPQRRNEGYVLGAVRCANVRWYNGLFIGLAPLAWLAVAVTLLDWRTRGVAAIGMRELLWAYIIACLVYAAIPSWQDIKVALVSSWLLVTLSIVMAWNHWMR